MKKKKIIYLLVSLALMLAVMTTCIVQSHRPGINISGTADSIAIFILNILGKEITEFPAQQPIILGLSIYKLGHLFGYLILGVVSFLFISAIFKLKKISIFEKENISLDIVISFILCLIFSISDEIHQLFTEGRTGSIFDVGIDTLGFTFGIAITSFIYFLIYRRDQYFVEEH